MEFKTEHLLAIAMIIVVIMSYFAQRAENHRQVQAVRLTQIEGCKGRAAADSFEAALGVTLHSRVAKRNQPGDAESGKRYLGTAYSVATTLAMPKGLKNPMRMVQVELVEMADGRYRYQLTADAKKLQAKGCEERYESK